MIKRFREVVPGVLYRGSSPSPLDVQTLQKKLGIKKIVSLDQKSGERISRACKLLGIQHVKLYIEDDKTSLLRFLTQNLKKLFLQNGPTFVHCKEGKDRTGLACALVKCKFLGVNPDKAIEEAKSLGFGIGIPPHVMHLYEKIIHSCKPTTDQNNADIVSNERTYIGDNRDNTLDNAQQGSFSPYLDPTSKWPNDAVYNYVDEQSPTRENYPDNGALQSVHDFSDMNVVPTIGVYDNDAGGRGFGPTDNNGGFIYD
jgi:protein-tyrosine phosphatase